MPRRGTPSSTSATPGMKRRSERWPSPPTRSATVWCPGYLTASAKLAGADPEVARDTSAFLKKQAQLLDTQNRYLEEEHGLRMAHLRHQLAEENMRRFGLRLRVGFQFFMVLVATALGAVAIIMVYDAFHSRNVVIDLFEVAPGSPLPSPMAKSWPRRFSIA